LFFSTETKSGTLKQTFLRTISTFSMMGLVRMPVSCCCCCFFFSTALLLSKALFVVVVVVVVVVS